MTPDELLKPRYKVIADWPDNSKHKISSIINAGNVEWPENYCEWLDTFPHLFKKLEWWEERVEDDMPEYFKLINGIEVYRRVSRIDGAHNAIVQFENGIYGKGTAGPIGLLNLLPATEQEYNDYLTSKFPTT